MQKIIPSVLIFCLSILSVTAQAEDAQPVTQTPAANDVVAQTAPASTEEAAPAQAELTEDQPLDVQEGVGALIPDQATITQALQDDILFQRKRRELTNELALAKLRAELQKIRGESGQSEVITTPVSPVHMADNATTETAVLPQVLLVSEVAGVSRVAVELDGSVKLVEPGRSFQASGKTYRLVKHGKNLVVREIP